MGNNVMKYIDEFRDPHLARALIGQIRKDLKQPLQLMEFCGGHTHAILRFGIRTLLPETLTMSSGPGCPVCVTSASDLDHAMALVRLPGVILTTFGDMVKVPGSQASAAWRVLREQNLPELDIRQLVLRVIGDAHRAHAAGYPHPFVRLCVFQIRRNI